jgi:integrative and conjugative element protein (TIGR02256 family)
MLKREPAKFSTKLISEEHESCPKLSIQAEVLAFIERTAATDPSAETGGILLGFHNGRNIRIVKASEAGPNAKRSSCGFLRDTQYCQQVLNEEHALSGADYVGEWHTHVIDLPRPSEGDLVTLTGIILDRDYNFPSFSMILAIVRGTSIQLLSYIVTAESHELKHLQGDSERQCVVKVARVPPELL